MKLFVIAVVTVFIGIAVAIPTRNANGLDLSQVYITNLTYIGSGCPPGSVSQVISDDRTSFTLIMNSLVASLDPTLPFPAIFKACHILASLHYPAGYQFSVSNVGYSGYVQLEKGVHGRLASTYIFLHDSVKGKRSTSFDGPIDQVYHIDDKVYFATTVWSPCDAPGLFIISNSILIEGKGNGIMTTDTIDGNVKHITGIQWRKCH